MRLRARIDGLDRFAAALGEAADDAALSAELRATAEDIRERAAANLADGAAPESRSGALAQSLQVWPDPKGGAIRVGTAMDHGWHLEHGSRLRPPSPWLAPAAEEARPAFLARMRSALNAALASALRRSA
jgi:hypothetical protein